MDNINEVPKGLLRMRSGRYVDVFNLRIEDIDIGDIAHGLSHIPRWAGQTYRFYSVADHSLDVMNRCHKSCKLEALLHDAPEAYLLDMPTPLKDQMPQYKLAERHIMQLIARKFGLTYPLPGAVKVADKEALDYEWEALVWRKKRFVIPRECAKVRYLRAFDSLIENREVTTQNK